MAAVAAGAEAASALSSIPTGAAAAGLGKALLASGLPETSPQALHMIASCL